MQPTLPKFGNLTPEAQAARLLHCRYLGVVSVHRLATEMGLPVERAELLMCRGLPTLIARGYPPPDAGATVSSCDNASLFSRVRAACRRTMIPCSLSHWG